MSHAPALPLPPESGMGPDRRTWLLASGAMGVTATAAVAVPFVASFAPSERAKAQGAAVTMDPASVAVGEVRTVEWRGQPVWVMRRTREMLASLEGMSDLADPASNKPQQPHYATNTHRSIKPELFVTVGICTHLGCSPVTLNQGTATLACQPTGRAASSAPATAPPSTSRAACSTTSPRPPTWLCRRTSTSPTAAC